VYGESKGESFCRTNIFHPAVGLRYMHTSHSMGGILFGRKSSWLCSGFRSDLETFRKMGAIKPELVLRYMQQYSLPTISLSDTDTVWLRNPKGD
jgi:hypothetical protein